MRTAEQILKENEEMKKQLAEITSKSCEMAIDWHAQLRLLSEITGLALLSSTEQFRKQWLLMKSQFHSTERVMEEIGKGWDMCNANRLSPCGYPNKDEYLSYIKKELEK